MLVWMLGNNVAGQYHVLQQWPSGTLRIIKAPGVYWAGPFSRVTKLSVSGVVSFVETYAEQKGERRRIEDPIQVVFKDNGQGKINGFVRYSLGSDDGMIRKIVEIARTEEVLQQLIRANINTTLTLVAASYKSGESVMERGRFLRDVLDSLQHGLLVDELATGDEAGNALRAPSRGQGERFPGLTKTLGISFVNFTLKSLDYDGQTQAKLDEHRLLEQQRDNAKLEAEKLKQETITAEARELKMMAETKAEEEHKKLEARIKAELAKEVATIEATTKKEVAQILLEKATLEKQLRQEEAEGNKIASMKEAEGRAALARADDSLALRLQMRKETLVGVANALKDMKVPTTIVGGKTSESGSGSPLLDIFLMNQIKDLERGQR